VRIASVERTRCDASVGAKWLFVNPREQHADKANALATRFSNAEIEIVVPDIFWAEIGNFLWKAVRIGRCTNDQAQAGLEKVQSFNLHTTSSRHLLKRAFEIAYTIDSSVYDSLYLALAVELGAALVTAHEKFANATATRYPVRLLSST
jgi:predicted nucleic acid-binding protein